MARTLGLDLGPNSIGWALIDDKTNTIIATGVRIFQEGVAHLNEGDREEPWNKQRRDAWGGTDVSATDNQKNPPTRSRGIRHKPAEYISLLWKGLAQTGFML